MFRIIKRLKKCLPGNGPFSYVGGPKAPVTYPAHGGGTGPVKVGIYNKNQGVTDLSGRQGQGVRGYTFRGLGSGGLMLSKGGFLLPRMAYCSQRYTRVSPSLELGSERRHSLPKTVAGQFAIRGLEA